MFAAAYEPHRLLMRFCSMDEYSITARQSDRIKDAVLITRNPNADDFSSLAKNASSANSRITRGGRGFNYTHTSGNEGESFS